VQGRLYVYPSFLPMSLDGVQRSGIALLMLGFLENWPSCTYKLTVAKPLSHLAVSVNPNVCEFPPQTEFTTLTRPGETVSILGQIWLFDPLSKKSIASHDTAEAFQTCSTWNWTVLPVWLPATILTGKVEMAVGEPRAVPTWVAGQSFGGAVGALVGALVGSFAVVTGAFVGALVGGLIGAFVGAFVGALVGGLTGAFVGAFVGGLGDAGPGAMQAVHGTVNLYATFWPTSLDGEHSVGIVLVMSGDVGKLPSCTYTSIVATLLTHLAVIGEP
jgi:hypothetical protein